MKGLLLGSLCWFSASAEAQTVIETTTTEARVSLEAEVVTTTTVLTTDAPVVVIQEVPEPPPSESSIVPVSNLRGELQLIEGDYDGVALGGSAFLGLTFGDGFSGGLVVGYLSGMGFSDPSELNLSLEVARDFSPDAMLGFLLMARLGTAFVLETEPQDSGLRMVGQLGIGARMSIDPRVAITTDVRALLRYQPDPLATRGADVAGGAAITMGVLIRLD